MTQPPSNLPPGLSFGRRTTAPVKLPRLDFPRLGGPMESQPTRLGEPGVDSPSAPAPFASAPPDQGALMAPFPMAPFPTTSIHPSAIPTSAIPMSAIPTSTTLASGIPTSTIPTMPIQLGDPAPTITVKEEPPSMMTSSGAPATIQDAREAAKVIVYGRSGSVACMRAIQDLMERQVSFQYVDVSRDPAAAAHLTAICNGEPVVPVIVHIGFGGV